jgi:hypothetical protein
LGENSPNLVALLDSEWPPLFGFAVEVVVWSSGGDRSQLESSNHVEKQFCQVRLKQQDHFLRRKCRNERQQKTTDALRPIDFWGKQKLKCYAIKKKLLFSSVSLFLLRKILGDNVCRMRKTDQKFFYFREKSRRRRLLPRLTSFKLRRERRE